jgi:signal transduction histidine kinase
MIAATIIAAFSGSAICLSARTLEREEVAFLSNSATQMAQTLDRQWEEESDLRSAAESAFDDGIPPGVHIDVLDAEGRTVLSSPPVTSAPHATDMRAVRVRASRGATIVASVSTRPRQQAIRALSVALLLTALPLLIAVVTVSRAIARQALRPLSRMAMQAESAAAQGVVHALDRPAGPTEVTTLAESFNHLLARLDEMLRAERHFTQDAAHELRTPLTVLSGEIEYAMSDPATPARLRDGLRHAADQVRAMIDLVEALMFLRRADAERVDSLQDFVPVNLSDLVRETSRDLLARSPERARDLHLAAGDEVLVAGNATLLSSALWNLLSNAFKFTETGQSVHITVHERDGRSWVVVEDGGRGIMPADRERIFDPFFRDAQARAHHDGFGLGLPILRRVARAHGGDVIATDSTLGGARFELSLPAWRPHR